jgi:hypothetical protein
MKKLPYLFALLLAGALLLAACGGEDDKEQYAEDVQGVLDPLGDELQTLGTELQGVDSPAGFAAALQGVEDRIDESVAELESIDPPEDVTEIHADLISALETFNASLEGVRESADDGRQALQAAAADLPVAALEFQRQMTEVTQRARDAGVPVEPEGVGPAPSGEGE